MQRILNQGDLVVALGIVLIVVMMIVPIPHALLDMFITINIAAALMIVLTTVYAQRALDFSVFPTLLLITTLFRLAINISVTRLILLEGDAGEVVESFGNFVVGGNIVVGLVVFFILMVVQFVVITNGAGRVAEVAARFTLDAMPGKQMAIDADLNAGQITDEQARERRQEIQREADFYGSMDGAAKFVKGDAIAAVIITLINLFGGIVVGMMQLGMGFSESVQRFSTLSIGDALAAAIPALLISTATGIIVTRAASDEGSNLGSDLSQQLGRHPKALIIVGSVLGALALLPGLPKIPFFLMAAALLGGGIMMRRATIARTEAARLAALQPEKPEQQNIMENVEALLMLDTLEIEIGYGLISLVDEEQGGDLLKRVSLIRRQMALDLGMILAPIRIRDNVQLASHEYAFKLKGAEIAKGQILAGCWLAMDPGDAEPGLEGTATIEPAFGLPAIWVPATVRDRAEAMGYTIVDPASIIVTHLTEVIRQNAGDLLTRQDARALLDTLKERTPAAVEELIPEVLNLGQVHGVLRELLAEGVSIRDLATIVETLADKGRLTTDVGMLADYCRQALSRTLLKPYMAANNTLYTLVLDQDLDQMISENVQHTEQGTYLNMDPATIARIVQAIKTEVEAAQAQGMNPVMMCSAKIRRQLRTLTAGAVPRLVLFSWNELRPDVNIELVGTVGNLSLLENHQGV